MAKRDPHPARAAVQEDSAPSATNVRSGILVLVQTKTTMHPSACPAKPGGIKMSQALLCVCRACLERRATSRAPLTATRAKKTFLRMSQSCCNVSNAASENPQMAKRDPHPARAAVQEDSAPIATNVRSGILVLVQTKTTMHPSACPAKPGGIKMSQALLCVCRACLERRATSRAPLTAICARSTLQHAMRVRLHANHAP